MLQAELREEILYLQEEFDAATMASKLVVRPFRDLLKEHKKMREIINVTIVEIELEELDDATVAFVKAQVEEQVLRVIVTESVQSNGKKCQSRDTFPAFVPKDGNEIDYLRNSQALWLKDTDELKKDLRISKEEIDRLDKELKSSQKNKSKLQLDYESIQGKNKELELQVIRFCKVQYCFGCLTPATADCLQVGEGFSSRGAHSSCAE